MLWPVIAKQQKKAGKAKLVEIEGKKSYLSCVRKSRKEPILLRIKQQEFPSEEFKREKKLFLEIEKKLRYYNKIYSCLLQCKTAVISMSTTVSKAKLSQI